MSPTTTQQRVDYRAAFPGSGMPNEQPILLSKCAGPNGVFNEIAADLQYPVVHELGQRFPPETGQNGDLNPSCAQQISGMRRISAAASQRREVPQPIQVLSWRAGFMCHAEKLKF